MSEDKQDYIEMLERTQIPLDHPLIQHLNLEIRMAQRVGFWLRKLTVDDLIGDLESRGLGWSLDHTGNLIEARVWDWPYVIGRYRPSTVVPLAEMLAKAMYEVDWTKYPVK